jgi:ATP-binding cassette subfamily F protein uup
MHLLKIDNVSLTYGEQVIFDGIDLQLNRGDRLCLVGRNGTGKSTLMKLIERKVEPESGSVWVDPGSTVASLMQELPPAQGESVFDFVASGLAELGQDLRRFATVSQNADSDAALAEMARLQQRIEAADGWRLNNRIDQVLTRLELNPDASLQDMSGGWRRRVALAQALVRQPEILLLDEPTNHLDIAAIEWLEKQLIDFTGAVVFVTHDRRFLRRVATRIAELDRGHLSVWNGDYDGFLKFRQEQLEAEEKQNALFDKKLAQEEVWIRQGIKARRTRNEGRVRALKRLRQERGERREQLGTAKIEHSADTASGKLVAELKSVSKRYGDKNVIDNFSTTVIRGDKIGLIGPNGVGKSTLLKLMLGEISPDSGTVRLGTNLSVAYFDQLREQLDPNKTAMDNIAEGRDFIEINGTRRHIISYLSDFLFTGERARTPIRTLSGGERNRILLAKLFSKPSNLLVMDEPTNDLDMETLELLEDLLLNYNGTLLLVSHDREFLDNVVTSTIAFEGEGRLQEYVGGYQDWLRQGGHWPQAQEQEEAPEATLAPQAQKEAVSAKEKRGNKLSYKLQRELDALPAKIEKQEKTLEALQEELAAPDFYQRDQDHVAARLQALADNEAQLQSLYERWEELELMREEGS